MNTDNQQEMLNSYNRTSSIVRNGLTEVDNYLYKEYEAREQMYLDMANSVVKEDIEDVESVETTEIAEKDN